MGRKIAEICPSSDPRGRGFLFFCPGCKCGHAVYLGIWTWNGSMDKPTFRASILTGGGVNFSERRCHSFVTDGRIEFLNDCHHALKGKTVDLPDIDHVNDDSAAAKMMFGEDPILNAD